MGRVLLITNPAAARTDPAVVRTVSTVLGREGWDVDVVGTTRPGHAAELAAAGVRDGADVVAVYAGDGTTMQAVKGLQGHDVPLALIPGGTGNLLAGNLRVPRDPAKAALVIARGVPRAIDLGSVARADGTHFFAVVSGAGFDAEWMASTTTEAKRRWKFAAYVAQGWGKISHVRNVPYRITVDGAVLEGEAATAMVANCGEFVPPLLKFGPGVALDDGVFDVLILSAEGFLESVGVAIHLIGGAGDTHSGIRLARGRVVQVEMDPPQPVQLDGDVIGETPFTAELLPGGLSVLVPREG